MKKLMTIKLKIVVGVVCLSLVLLTSHAFAAGLLTPKDSGLPDLEIRDHRVKVIVEDGYAITAVDQVFYNPNNQIVRNQLTLLHVSGDFFTDWAPCFNCRPQHIAS